MRNLGIAAFCGNAFHMVFYLIKKGKAVSNNPQKTIMRFKQYYPRKDGRWPVQFFYPGAPNAFGGFYPGKTINKVLKPDDAMRLADSYEKTGIVENRPPILK